MTGVSERVRVVIDESGVTDKEFARRIGLDPTKLSKSLRGDRRFTSLELALIAEQGRHSVDWLVTGKRPDWALAARSNTSVSSDAVTSATRLAELREDLAFLGYRHPWNTPPGLAPTGNWVTDGASLADWACSVLERRPPDGDEFADHIERAFGLDVAIQNLDGADGLALSNAETKLIVAATSSFPARQRFTIAHELGHLLWGDNQEVHVDTDVFESGRRESEVRANAFAAAFLMPRQLMREYVEGHGHDLHALANLAIDISVSPSALAYRLANLELIPVAVSDELRQLRAVDAAKSVGRLAELARRMEAANRPRVPRALLEDSFQAYLDGEATLRPYASLVGEDPDTIRSVLEFAAPAPDAE